jgi:ADP-ribosyl-[dinitrogen reductase] hydrolase
MLQANDKILGCILGGAIGDCLGLPFEGTSSPVEIDHQRHWKLSDDTQMTLATCEAITTHGSADAATIADTFTLWFKQRRLTGLGASTYKALSELSLGGHWALVGRKGDMAAGNGAAMRVAPLAFCLDLSDRKERTIFRDICRITHHSEEAYVGALAVALAIQAAWNETWQGGNNLLEQVLENLPDSVTRDRLIEISTLNRNTSVFDIATTYGCSGYVAETVPLALFGAQQINKLGFQGVLESLITCGGDTDTIASITGQVMGALLGKENLPTELIECLPTLTMITKTTNLFSEIVLSQR